jgi:hypothetical protein
MHNFPRGYGARGYGVSVPIRPFLAGRPFEPELIEHMSAALVSACEALQLQVIDDAATRMVARTIIDLAERGVRDAETLLKMTLREFGLGEK